MLLTYQTLIKTHVEQLRSQGASPQVVRNHMSALRKWLEFHGKYESSDVGEELTDEHFAQALNKHLDLSQLGTKSLADRRSMLRAWQATFLSHDGVQEASKSSRARRRSQGYCANLGVFETTLKEALSRKKLTPKAAARLSGTSTSAVGRWSRGGLPNVRSVPNLQKLEALLELEPNVLKNAWQEALGQQKPLHQNTYRTRLSTAHLLTYILKPAEISPSLHAEWKGLMNFKTCMKPFQLVRRPGAKWSLVDPKDTLTKPWAMTLVGGQVSATAGLVWKQVSSYLGYLSTHNLEHGLEPSNDFVQTLAWLAVPEMAESFLAFKRSRSAGLSHRGQLGFCTLIADLTHPEHGYLTQIPSAYAKLPEAQVQGRDWLTLCAQSYEMAKLYKAAAKDTSRDPASSIQFFLEQPEPLQPLFLAMKKLEAIASAAPTDSLEQLMAKRDRLLIGLLLANPLRAKHWVTLRCAQGSSGDIYRTTEGTWRIRIPGKQFKNHSRVSTEIYNVPIPTRLTPLLDDYVQNVRPKFLGRSQDTGEFFLNSSGKRFNSFGGRVLFLTRRLIPGCGGIGPHAFRHLVATDWLTKNPNDVVTVAELLNDSVDVVIQNYTHLKKDAAFSRYEAYVNSMIESEEGPHKRLI